MYPGNTARVRCHHILLLFDSQNDPENWRSLHLRNCLDFPWLSSSVWIDMCGVIHLHSYVLVPIHDVAVITVFGYTREARWSVLYEYQVRDVSLNSWKINVRRGYNSRRWLRECCPANRFLQSRTCTCSWKDSFGCGRREKRIKNVQGFLVAATWSIGRGDED